MKKVVLSQIAPFCAALTATTFIVLPFHAFFTVWAGSTLGHYDWFRLWIELVLLVLTPLAATLVWQSPRLRSAFQRDALVWAILIYIAWQLLLGAWALARGQVNHTALLTGWAIDLRFVLFLLVAWVAAFYRPWLAARWRELLLIPAAVTVAFGLLEAWLLSADFLKHFGYGPKTVQPFTTVDQKSGYVRLQSTLRGPNPFGAYLVLALTAFGSFLVRGARKHWRVTAGALFVGGAIALGVTYSRSAYIGMVLSLVVLAWLLLTAQRARQLLLAAVAVGVLLVASLFLALRHNDRFQNTFFHTDKHSASAESSNEVRTLSLQQGAHDVLQHPLGRGPGSAGPASVHNGTTRIAENYYLQIGQEVGWLGLALFLAINVLVACKLWQRRTSQLASVLLASFVGISFVNLLSHAWADDTLGMLWWGFAGVALGAPLAAPKKTTRRKEAV